jgi:hypothetical protein
MFSQTHGEVNQQHTREQARAFAGAGEAGVQPLALVQALEAHRRAHAPRMELLWAYYRNPMRLPPGGPRDGRAYSLGQQRGLPLRLSNPAAAGVNVDDRTPRREVVIENDIAWRIGAMVDFLVSGPVAITSQARDAGLAREIELALAQVWGPDGGATLLHELALLAHVFGHADVLVAPAEDGPDAPAPARVHDAATLRALDPRQAVRITGPAPAWAEVRDGQIVLHTPTHTQAWSVAGDAPALRWQARSRVSPGVAPVARLVCAPEPGAGDGAQGVSEVEALIPLQDELNTRLSDRAYRVTLQSFKMYLAKGLSTFGASAVGPGVIWTTDNPDAHIESFGGDASSPSEDRHIDELREAMDKVSAVPPLATGVVRARVGNLSSESALRLTMQGLLTRTRRKRLALARAVQRASELALAALDTQGLLRTREEDRAVRAQWPQALDLEGARENG